VTPGTAELWLEAASSAFRAAITSRHHSQSIIKQVEPSPLPNHLGPDGLVSLQEPSGMGNVVVPPEHPSTAVASVPRTRRERVVIETRAEVLTRSILVLQARLLRIVLGVVRHRVASPHGVGRGTGMGNGQSLRRDANTRV
jgi:hypothetical protein